MVDNCSLISLGKDVLLADTVGDDTLDVYYEISIFVYHLERRMDPGAVVEDETTSRFFVVLDILDVQALVSVSTNLHWPERCLQWINRCWHGALDEF